MPTLHVETEVSQDELLQSINRGLSADLGARLRELQTKSEDESLTPDEHGELLAVVGRAQELFVRRLESLTRLARLRGVSLADLMNQLGIHPPDDG